jgi:hypothetical protein
MQILLQALRAIFVDNAKASKLLTIVDLSGQLVNHGAKKMLLKIYLNS